MSRSHRHHPRAHPHGSERREPQLLVDIRRAIRGDHPIDLLGMVSDHIEATTPRPTDPMTGRQPIGNREALIRFMREVDRPETTALMHAYSILLRDSEEKAEIDTVLSRRRHRLPDWVAKMGDATVTGTAELTNILGDGENVFLELTWPHGPKLTIVVYVDHNLGTLVKDAFLMDEPLTSVRADVDKAADPETVFAEIDPSEARARVTQAIQQAERTLPPFESETWPACRPLVEWAVDMLPHGGAGFVRKEWTEDERDQIAEQFLASEFGEGFDEPPYDYLLHGLIWFGCDYGPDDPLLWSPVSVEIVLADWFPRKHVAPIEELAALPDLLRAFIRFAHHERDIPAYLTNDTLDAVDLMEPHYHAAIGDPDRMVGGLAIAEAARLFMNFDMRPLWEHTLETLERQAGGTEALDQLDDAPIPDEPFDWAGIPDDVHERVQEVLDWTDRCCDELLDVEARTAVRRLLSRVATGDPEVFRRRGKAETAAAALVWSVGRANDLFGEILVKDLMAWFGLGPGSPSQRASTLLRAAGIPGIDSWEWRGELGDPDLLVAAKRRRMIETRDRVTAQLASE